MRRLLAPFVVSLALLALLTGCSSHQPLFGLAVELVKLERAADGSVTATLQVVNSTVVSYNITSSKHQVFLNGRLAGTIEIVEPLGVPAQHSMTQGAHLKLAGAGLVSGPASYRLDSELTLALYDEAKEMHRASCTGTVQVP